ncbi:MAG: hypothetical protein N2512_09505, partial [Armatimonadetes bacterium]|nr:hypothetical protein [Armatimonadota bacterium]
MKYWVFAWTGALLGALELALLASGRLMPELVRGGTPLTGWVLLPLAGLAVVIWACRMLWATSYSEKRARGVLAAAALGLCFLSGGLSVCHPLGFGYLAALVLNPASNSYYQTARDAAGLWKLLEGYDAKMLGFRSHAQTQGAGPVVFYGLLSRAVAALPTTAPIAETALALRPGLTGDALAAAFARWWRYELRAEDVSSALFCGWAVVVLGALAVFPLHRLAEEIAGRRSAAVAVGAYCLFPP